MTERPQISIADARRVLGVGADADAAEVRRAFHAAVMAAHPDRPGGGPDAFGRVMEAYGRLKNAAAEPVAETSPERAPEAAPGFLTITPMQALQGGSTQHRTEGRTLAVHLPAGLRAGDVLKAGDLDLAVMIRTDGQMQVRGHDLWVTAPVPAETLETGGRAQVMTPVGERLVWVTRRTAEAGLVRLEGEGLPARGLHPQGHLFLKLIPEAAGETAARSRLRSFAAMWAA